MKRSRLLPAAAGIIALTATLGFPREQRENEADNISRSKITLIFAQIPGVAVDGAPPDGQLGNRSTRPAYLVEIRRGDTMAKVMIDAVTGQILADATPISET